jgi:hypothetical protein
VADTVAKVYSALAVRFEDRASGTAPDVTLADGVCQNAFQDAQVSDLGSYFLHTGGGKLPCFDAHVLATPWRQAQQLTNIFQVEAQLPRSANESQSRNIVGTIAPKSAALPSRLREQADPLVIADRRDVTPALPRELADRDVGKRSQILSLLLRLMRCSASFRCK